MTRQLLSTADQKPLHYIAESPEHTPLGHSYWHRVWHYLRADYSSVLALILLTALLLACFIGASIWRVDPNLQNSGIRFSEPRAAELVKVVDDQHWQGQAVDSFQAIAANTQYVRLAWPVLLGEDLRLYRMDGIQQEGLGRLIAAPSAAYFEDRFELREPLLRYSLVSSNNELVAQIDVQPEQALSQFYAQMTGLVDMTSSQTHIEIPAHPLGTDGLGRDTLARLIAGGRITLGIGIMAPLLATLFGLCYGAISGFIGGRTDEILMRFADFVIALPFLLFVILLNVALGFGPQSSGVLAMFIALTVMTWPSAAKLVRGHVLVLREAAYIDAARLLGGSSIYIIRVHILPSVLGAVLVALSFAIPSAIFTEALLSFIGLGVQAPAASWGSMSQEAIHELQRHPMQLVYPAGLISITVLAFNILGDSLRDALAVAGGKHD